VEPLGQIGRKVPREVDDEARRNWQAPPAAPTFDTKVDDDIPF
jgi:hypothetical protein